MPKVLVTDHAWPDLEIERRVLSEIGVDVVAAPDGNEETLARLAEGASGILTCWAKTTRKVIAAALPDLRVIVRYGVGLDNIDIPFATQNRIPVANVPDYCFEDVAEHTMALLLSLSRKVTAFDRSVRAATWDIRPQLPLHRLSGRTLGLIGFGQIPQAVVPKARAFGLRVKAHSRSLTQVQASEAGIERADLHDLLASSDFVSVHCPLTDATRGLIGREALGRMKRTAFLINTSRGPVVDEAALADALEKGEIAGAALDVRCQEPPPAGDRLIGLPNVIHTPHAAFYSAESLAELQEKAAWEARRVLSGQRPVHLVNGVGA